MRTIVTNLIEDYEKCASYWSGSIFESVTHFSQDYKGKFGELRFSDGAPNLHTLQTMPLPVEWDEDENTNNNDGVYDLFWYLHNGKKRRVEVKTSGRTFSKGKPKGWQHDNVYFLDNEWDKLVCIDYDANDVVFFTIVDYSQVVKDDTIDLSLFGHNIILICVD